MLVVHWTPVSNTKVILKNGIRKSKTGLYCFPLTGIKQVDKWWVTFFNRCGAAPHRQRYNGIVFKLMEADFPVYFGSWAGATSRDVFSKNTPDLAALEKEYRDVILFRAGEAVAWERNEVDYSTPHEFFLKLGKETAVQNPRKLAAFQNSCSFMEFTLEDFQIVLSRSVSADRIIKVIPQGDEYGKIVKRKKKWGFPKHRKQAEEY